MSTDPRRELPAVGKLVDALAHLPRPLVVEEARALVHAVRAGAPAPCDWAQAVSERVAARQAPSVRRVINATGVVLHTNLGRAPLAAEAVAAVTTAAAAWTNLELDLATGARGDRTRGVAARLRTLTGAEAALAVNNNAAAVLLVLSALAAGREVIVSRGELVEIGGSFRVPQVVAAGGARLVEVGTTNRTRVSDYARAITPHTAAILRVHPSNFRVSGFTEAPDRAELHALARSSGIPLVDDLGSGALVDDLGEPSARAALATADLVCFSGDKLLGGPQAGLLCGRAALVEQARRHPLYRALRLDRLVLAALDATLAIYEAGGVPPAVSLLRATPDELAPRARALAATLGSLGLDARANPGASVAGGGALPEVELPSFVVRIRVNQVGAVAAALRQQAVPVVARVVDDELLVDLRTVLPGDDEALLAGLVACAGARDPG